MSTPHCSSLRTGSRRARRVVAIAGLTLLCQGALLAGPGDHPTAAEEREMRRELFSRIIDKPAIAKRHVDRVVGLREVGNPHVPVGSALRNAKFAEAKSDEYAKQLREHKLSLYGVRGKQWKASSESTKHESKELAKETEETPKRSPLALFANYAAVGIALICALGLVWQTHLARQHERQRVSKSRRLYDPRRANRG